MNSEYETDCNKGENEDEVNNEGDNRPERWPKPGKGMAGSQNKVSRDSIMYW